MIPQQRFELIPDVNGQLHNVDLFKYVSKERSFDPLTGVKFVLSTRNVKRVVFQPELDSIKASGFDKNHPTRILIHGWMGDLTSDINGKVVDEYLKNGDYNCISVDWSSGAGDNK